MIEFLIHKLHSRWDLKSKTAVLSIYVTRNAPKLKKTHSIVFYSCKEGAVIVEEGLARIHRKKEDRNKEE